MRRAFLLLALAACEGGKGNGPGGPLPDGDLPVDADTRIVDLTMTERADVCAYFEEVLGPERTVDCGDGSTANAGTMPGECSAAFANLAASAPNCPITAGQYDMCVAALAALTDAQRCEGADFPAECSPLLDSQCSAGDSVAPMLGY